MFAKARPVNHLLPHLGFSQQTQCFLEKNEYLREKMFPQIRAKLVGILTHTP